MKLTPFGAPKPASISSEAKKTEASPPPAAAPAATPRDTNVLFTHSLVMAGRPDAQHAIRMREAVLDLVKSEPIELSVTLRKLSVVGTDAAGAEAISKEFNALAAIDYDRALPGGFETPHVIVLKEADFVRLMGPMANDHDARWITDGKRGAQLVLRESAVERSKVDGTAVREALLLAMYSFNAQGYMAAVATGPMRGRLVRGSSLYPDTLRAASDVDAFQRVVNLREEDPNGRVDAKLIAKENQRRATQGKPPIDYVYLPIRDYDVPSREVERQLVEALKDPRVTYLHCKAGIGRTGLVDAMAAIIEGVEPDHAIQAHQDWFYSLNMVGEVTEPQMAYLRDFGERWKRGDVG